MKGLDHTPEQENISESREHHKTTLVSQMVFIPGLPTWEYDPETKILGEATFKTSTIEVNNKHSINPFMPEHKNTVHRILQKKDGCLYFQSLNRKNALRKIEKLFQSKT